MKAACPGRSLLSWALYASKKYGLVAVLPERLHALTRPGSSHDRFVPFWDLRCIGLDGQALLKSFHGTGRIRNGQTLAHPPDQVVQRLFEQFAVRELRQVASDPDSALVQPPYSAIKCFNSVETIASPYAAPFSGSRSSRIRLALIARKEWNKLIVEGKEFEQRGGRNSVLRNPHGTRQGATGREKAAKAGAAKDSTVS